MRTAINAVIIRGDSILLVKKKDIWILPGGKPENDESDIQCLIREITKEEIPGTKLSNFRFYGLGEFKGRTPHRGDTILVKAYFADIQGEIKPGAEIVDVRWAKKTQKYKLSEITKKIFKHLKEKGYL